MASLPDDLTKTRPSDMAREGKGQGSSQNGASGTNSGSTSDPISLSSILIQKDSGQTSRPGAGFVSTSLKSRNASSNPLSTNGMSTLVAFWPAAKVAVPLRAK